MQNLANILMALKQYDEAEALTRESLKGMEAQFGDDYAQTLASMNTLAYLLEERGKVDEAEAAYRRIIEIQTRGGVEHPTTLAPRNNLAMLLMKAGRFEPARAEFAALLKHSRAALPRHALSWKMRISACLGFSAPTICAPRQPPNDWSRSIASLVKTRKPMR